MSVLQSSNIPNLTGGVSQQPSGIRRENQFESQTNAYATMVEGLTPRRPTYHVAKLIAYTVGPSAFWHFLNRSPTEQYVACIQSGSLRVFDMITGAERSVSFPDGTAYLTAALPRESFKAVTVADYTFVVNTSMVTAMAPTLSPKAKPCALVNVKLGNYGKTYTININGAAAASYATPDGSVASQSSSIDTTNIASQLATSFATLGPAGFTMTRYGCALYISNPAGVDFTIDTVDGYSGLALIAIKDQTQRFTDLPQQGPEGFVIGITGDKGLTGDLYYLKLTKVSSVGVWKETVAPGIKYAFDTSTMPWQLIRNSDGTFTFKKASWIGRAVGDATTNPNPSFVGRALNDVYFSRNRLGFSAGENAVNSRSGEFFTFWRRTVTTLLDDDPVDVAVTAVNVSNIAWAVPFNKTLVLFADQGQHELGSAGVLTPKTAAVVPTSEYEASRLARPATTGTSVFFAVEQDGYAQVREYYNDGQSAAAQATAFNTTEHCPRYIPAGVFRLTASRSEDVMAALTTADPTAIYVYRYLGAPSDRIQSAWTKWSMGGTVLAASFVKADLWVIMERDNAVWLEKIPLAAGKVDPGVSFLTYLDRRVDETGLTVSYNTFANSTTFTLPYRAEGSIAVVRYSAAYSGTYLPGQTVPTLSTTDSTITLVGDHRTTPITFGFTIRTTIELSKFYPRERRSATKDIRTTIIDGRLQLKYLTFLVGNTASFRVVVKPQGRAATTKTFNGLVVGVTALGIEPLYSGRVRIPVMTRGDTAIITIVHDSHLPMAILAMEWEGLFSIRSSRSV